MKVAKFYLLLVALCLTCAGVLAQAPQKFNYQAVVRDGSGNVITNRNVSMRFTIHTGSPTGVAEFVETDTVHTSSIGVITVVVGGGAIDTGSMNNVNWANSGGVYLQVELDPNGGNSFTDMGTTQMISVPFALYAASAGNNAVGPRGATGPQGPVGTQGLQGVPGAQGATGVTGVIGSTGPQGATGNKGLDGATGAMGLQGPVGVAGPIGATGPQGATGNDGAVGATGPIGLQGPAGVTGAQGATGNDGAVGATGSAGLQGPAGTAGTVGAAGPAGPQGPAGTAGAVGAAGPAGPAGPQGAAGAAGSIGPQGVQGLTGATGPADSVWSVVGSDINLPSGNVGINQPSPQAALDVNGFTRLGSSGPIMQMYCIPSAVSPPSAGTSVTYSWSIADTKILHVSVLIHTSYYGVIEAVQGSSSTQFAYTIQNGQFTLTAPYAIGSGYLTQPVTVLVTYMQ